MKVAPTVTHATQWSNVPSIDAGIRNAPITLLATEIVHA